MVKPLLALSTLEILVIPSWQCCAGCETSFFMGLPLRTMPWDFAYMYISYICASVTCIDLLLASSLNKPFAIQSWTRLHLVPPFNIPLQGLQSFRRDYLRPSKLKTWKLSRPGLIVLRQVWVDPPKIALVALAKCNSCNTIDVQNKMLAAIVYAIFLHCVNASLSEKPFTMLLSELILGYSSGSHTLILCILDVSTWARACLLFLIRGSWISPSSSDTSVRTRLASVRHDYLAGR